MKVRVPEFKGFKLDPHFTYTVGDGYIFTDCPIKVFGHTNEPTFNFIGVMERVGSATREELQKIKAEYLRFVQERRLYENTEPQDLFDEVEDELLDLNGELFLTMFDTPLREQSKPRRWSGRDQIDFDYDGQSDGS